MCSRVDVSLPAAHEGRGSMRPALHIRFPSFDFQTALVPATITISAGALQRSRNEPNRQALCNRPNTLCTGHRLLPNTHPPNHLRQSSGRVRMISSLASKHKCLQPTVFPDFPAGCALLLADRASPPRTAAHRIGTGSVPGNAAHALSPARSRARLSATSFCPCPG